MKVLVIGADGLLGTHIVQKLLHNQHEVKAFVQTNSPSPTLQGLPVEKVEGDLLNEDQTLISAIKGCDVVIHAAAITNQWAPADLTWKVNCDGTQKVLSGCLNHSIKKLIFIGSASTFAFGTMDNPGDENNGFPIKYKGIAYMESKHKATQLVLDAAKESKIETVVVSPTFMLGLYDFRPSSGELILQFIRRQMNFSSKGGRNFAYASDVAMAVVNAMDKGRSGECYIAGGENLSYKDFFTRVANVYGISPPKWIIPNFAVVLGGAVGSTIEKITGKQQAINLRIAKLSTLETYYSSNKAIKELEMPQTSVEQGIKDCIQSLKEYGHL